MRCCQVLAQLWKRCREEYGNRAERHLAGLSSGQDVLLPWILPRRKVTEGACPILLARGTGMQGRFLSLLGDHCGKVNDNEVLISAAVSLQWSPLSYSNRSKGDLRSEVLAKSWICSESKLGILLFLKAKARMLIFSQILLLAPFTFYSLKVIFYRSPSYSHIDYALGTELCFNFTVNCSADLIKYHWKPLPYALMSYPFLIDGIKNVCIWYQPCVLLT